VYKILVGKLEGKRPLTKPIHRWDDNIQRDLREIGMESMDWIHMLRIRTIGRLFLTW
jgi:hypothetical protein